MQSLTHTLHNLLPTYNPPASLLTTPGQTLPSQLTDLAAALLAQSRSRAANLKADEEIARGYAVCHLAAERLKTRLDLPKIEIRPPCTSKVYKKLYQFLDGVLTTDLKQQQQQRSSKASEGGLRTPTKAKDGDNGLYTSSLAVRSADMPRQQGSSTAKASVTPTPVRKRKLNDYLGDAGKISENDQKLTDSMPDWVAPAIRHLCKKFDASAAAVPHVFVGAATLTKREDKTKSINVKPKSSAIDPQERDRLPATIVAVLLLVMEKLNGDAVNEDVTQAIKLAVQELLALKRITPRQSGIVVVDARRFLLEERDKWTAMEWYQNIPEPEDTAAWKDSEAVVSHGEDGEDGERSMPVRERLKDEANVSEGALLIGLGTMMQDRVDWLSEARRKDYIKWKAGVMKKIAQIEREQSHARVVKHV